MNRALRNLRNKRFIGTRPTPIPPYLPNQTKRIVSAASYQGPIPPPFMLAQFDEIHKGFANRIMKMAENESKHSINQEETALKGYIWERRTGQICALIFCLSALGAGTYCIFNGHSITGTILGAGGLATIVSAFLYDRGAFIKKKQES